MANNSLEGPLSRKTLGLPSLSERLRIADPHVSPLLVAHFDREKQALEEAKRMKSLPTYPVAGPNEIDLYSIDRYLDNVSFQSRTMFEHGMVGLMMVAGDEDANLSLNDDSLQRIESVRDIDGEWQADISAQQEFLYRIGWPTPLEDRQVDYLVHRCFWLCRFLRRLWEIWEECHSGPVDVGEALGTFRMLHGRPKLEEEHLLRTRTQRAEKALHDWSNRIHRVTHVHPVLVRSEFEQINREMKEFADGLSNYLQKAERFWKVESKEGKPYEFVHVSDEHLTVGSYRAIRAWLLHHRFKVGPTEAARRLRPELKDKYKDISRKIKEVDKMIGSPPEEEIEPQILGTELAKMWADDMEAVLPRFG